MPLKSLRKAILAKVEVTPGTDVVPVAGTDAILVRNWQFNPLQLNLEQRQMVLIYFGNDGQMVAGKYCQAQFEAEMAGAGSAGGIPKYDALLQGCALSATNSPGVSQTYAPVSSGEKSLTFYFYQDGILHKMVYAKGNVGVKLDAGKVPVFTFSFVGLYVTVADAALITPTLTGFTKPLPVNNANTTPMTLDSYAGAFSALSLDAGNQMKYRNLVGAEYIVFMDRQSKGSISMEKPLTGTKDFYTIVNGGTTKALTVTHGTVAGNKVTIAAGQAQLTSASESDQDGIAMLSLGMDLLPSSAGNDEFSIVAL